MKLSIINFYLTTINDSTYPRHFNLFNSLKDKIEVNLYGCANNHYINGSKKSFNGIYWINSLKYTNNYVRFLSITLFFFKLILNRKYKIHKYVLISDPFLAFYFCLFRKFFSYKIIYEIRDVNPISITRIYNFSKYNPMVLYLSFIEKYLLRNSYKIITNLENYSKRLNEFKLKKKIFFLPNKLDNSNLILKSKNKDKSFLYAGYVSKASNLDFVIKSFNYFNKNKNNKFYIVGHGPLFNPLKRKYHSKFVKFIFSKKYKTYQNFAKKSDFGIISYVFDNKIYSYGIAPRRLIFYLNNNILPIFIGSFKLKKFLNVDFLKIKTNNKKKFSKLLEFYNKNTKLINDKIIKNYKKSYHEYNYDLISKKLLLFINDNK